MSRVEERQWAIFDIDGCLSDDRKRRHLLPNWDVYHQRLGNDELYAPVASLIRSASTSFKVALVTGRPTTFRQETIAWLIRNGVEYDLLLMRPAGDKTPSPGLKIGLLTEEGIWAPNIGMVVDDRSDVLSAFNRWGVSGPRIYQITIDSQANPLDGTPTVEREDTMKPSLNEPTNDNVPTDEKQFDPVEKPKGYNMGEIEAVDACRAMLTPEEFQAHCRATAFKYIWRMPHKDTPEENARKAMWYLSWCAGVDPRSKRAADEREEAAIQSATPTTPQQARTVF